MVSLKTAGLRFDSLMYRLDGLPFHGTIEPDLKANSSATISHFRGVYSAWPVIASSRPAM